MNEIAILPQRGRLKVITISQGTTGSLAISQLICSVFSVHLIIYPWGLYLDWQYNQVPSHSSSTPYSLSSVPHTSPSQQQESSPLSATSTPDVQYSPKSLPPFHHEP